METFKKKKQVEVDTYKTLDGKEFTNKKEAEFHEDVLNGNKKICTNCNGKGRINERYEKEWQNTSWIPTEGEYVDVRKSDECPVCKGKGFLELNWS